MARVKRAVHGKKHRRAILEQAQGYYGNKSRSFHSANEQVMHSLQYAYRDRRARKGDFRKLWIQRINAACPPARHELQPLHQRPEGRRGRGRPQGAGRPRRHRPGRVRRAGRGGRGAASAELNQRRRHGLGAPSPRRCSGSAACCASAARARRSGRSSSKAPSSSPRRSTPGAPSRRCSSRPAHDAALVDRRRAAGAPVHRARAPA